MNRFLKLVNFEFSRFLKLYLILLGITVLVQIVGVIVEARRYVGKANKAIYEDLLSKSDFISQYGTMSFFNFSGSVWFMGPIVLSGVTLLIYVFFIWYRDWLGKNTFSYRLLVLPTARLNIYLAKATTILLFVLGLIALQLILITIELQILQWLVPEEFHVDFPIAEVSNFHYLNILFPMTVADFILIYGVGIVAVCVVFTAILFERSYRLKGIFFGILYAAVSILVFFAPILVNEFILGNYFYANELFYMELGTCLLTLAGAIWIGNYLMNKKIRV
ncbi:hypothetical protein [Fredinandcohnia onubensis]|uniref:hypothetical protein n=1 Tax=Fredinandcohnia onubensis TaxID=1571209 RepID=UPI000C0C0FCD|nr:hypothetical protein [Fredinandcohnia onubensis]